MPIDKKTLAAVNDAFELNVSEALSGTAVFQLFNITGTITVAFEAKTKGAPTSAWTAVQATNLANGTQAATATAVGLYRVDASGELDLRVRVTVSGPGTVDVYPGISLG
jgi:hypothetical protein